MPDAPAALPSPTIPDVAEHDLEPTGDEISTRQTVPLSALPPLPDAPDADESAPAFQPIDPMIGLVVDSRYRIERRLARGGMATVYVAHDERLERPVALKLMHPANADRKSVVWERV